MNANQTNEVDVFDAEALSSSDATSSAIQIPARVVKLLGEIGALAGGAALVTISVEVSEDGVNDWRPQPFGGVPSESPGLSVSALNQFQITRASAGLMPPFSFEPAARFFRVKAKTDAGTSTITMTAKTEVEA